MSHGLRSVSRRAAILALMVASFTIVIPTGANAATVRSVSTGMDHACTVTSTGGVRCWGNNDRGQLGNGSLAASTSPVDVVGLSSGVAAVSAGGEFSCALTTGGGVRCWGWGTRLGVGSGADSPVPVTPAGLGSNVLSVSAGWSHSCALKDDHTVWCWGSNQQGALGDGTRTTTYLPIQVPGLSGIASVSTSGAHTCALTDAGGVRCWGYNAYGQVGNGTAAPTPDGDVLIPTDVVGLTSGVSAIAPGGYHSCALLSAGGAVCWGRGGSGQLGDGNTTYRNEPVAVATPPGISLSSIAAGEYHTCAITSQGGTMCWGDNVAGGLGLGDEVDRWVPTDVPGLSENTASLDAGRWSTCRVDTAGRTMCWGWNLYGQAGNGTTSVSVTRPSAVAWFAPRFSSSCSGLACTFTDTSIDPDQEVVTRGWTFGEGGSAAGATVARTYPAGGTYVVALTLVDATGTSVTSQRSITVTPWSLVATVTKVKNVTTVRLTWNATATTSPTVDVVRGGTQRTTVANTGSYSQTLSKGTFTFVVCPTGDTRCSNSVTVKV